MSHAALPRPVVLAILDGIGVGDGGEGDAVAAARTPHLDALRRDHPYQLLTAHGRAVGLPSDRDMGNSEVGHNAMGAGRIVQQGASLVNAALASGEAFGETWRWLTDRGTLHLLGLVSDGNVHSHVDHLHALLDRAEADGLRRIRVHVLTDGRDVGPRTALTWVRPLEERLARMAERGIDAAIASGGGRMAITMDRYEADWEMVARGWRAHVHGIGRPFQGASEAIATLYAEDPAVDDQRLPPFVIVDARGEPVGRVQDGDGVLLFNFRGDRAIEISRAFEGREVPFDRGIPGRPAPRVRFAGMMRYDGDLGIPERFLVPPPRIDHTVGEVLAAAGRRTYAISETQKFGHVTYFFNGNRSGRIDPDLECYVEIPSEDVPFDQRPAMRAPEIAARACEAIVSGAWDHVRLNFANGDMVGHTGNLAATIEAVEVVDACVGRLVEAVARVGGVLLVTADHGNADQMYELDPATGRPRLDREGRPVVRTSHSLNPVPFHLFDPRRAWRLVDPRARPSIAAIGPTLLVLAGLEPPPAYLPPLVARR